VAKTLIRRARSRPGVISIQLWNFNLGLQKRALL
jgi:hypothetical protein